VCQGPPAPEQPHIFAAFFFETLLASLAMHSLVIEHDWTGMAATILKIVLKQANLRHGIIWPPLPPLYHQ
jgi:hypothetical protein